MRVNYAKITDDIQSAERPGVRLADEVLAMRASLPEREAPGFR